MLWIMLSMRSEEVVFVISNSSRALILLGSFSKCRIVTVSSIGRISCPAFSICSENVDFPVDVVKSLLCSLNLVLKFLFVLVELVAVIACQFVYSSLFEFVVIFDAIAYYILYFVACFQPDVDVFVHLFE
jgi:hypothetical protein